MNAYLVDGLEIIRVYEEWYQVDEVYPIGIYVAKTRGQAHAMFNGEWDFEWTEPKSIRLIATNVEEPMGSTGAEYLWDIAAELKGWPRDEAQMPILQR